MALKFLIDLLTGNLVLVETPASILGGTALFANTTGINFADGTSMNWIT